MHYSYIFVWGLVIVHITHEHIDGFMCCTVCAADPHHTVGDKAGRIMDMMGVLDVNIPDHEIKAIKIIIFGN